MRNIDLQDISDMQEIKNEYDCIPVPEELESKVRAAIQKARLQKRKENSWIMKTRKIVVGVGATAAAFMVGITGLANSNASIASAMEQIPVLGAITRVVTFRTYEDETGGASAHIEVPQVEGGEAVNDAIKEYTNTIIAQYEKDAELYDHEESLGETDHYSLDISYETVTDNEKVFGLRLNQTQIMASGYETVVIYNVDKSTGKIMSLGDLFQKDSNYLDVLTQNIQQQMRDQMQVDESVYYWLDDEVEDWNFKQLSENATFYINKNGNLVIVFNEGDVAPMYMGVCEFVIPSDVTSEIALPGYLG